MTATATALPDWRVFGPFWRAGDLRWLLHDDQARLYDEYRVWQADMHQQTQGQYRRVFVADYSRRWGKDFWSLVIKCEDCLREPGSTHTYGTAFARDISEIVIPLMDDILATCPDDVRPQYHESSLGEQAGFYFPNGSRLKLVGIDRHRHALRGRGSDGVVITEAAYVEYLREAVVSILYPQLQGRPNATIILQSTAPEFSEGNAYDEDFIPDAKLREAYGFGTIEDNPLLSAEERAEFIDAAGGREHPTCRREYFGERVRDHSRAVVPEYDDQRHVMPLTPPEYADCYVALDPGMRDLCAVVWGYWDAERAKLCVQRDWAERNASTESIARILESTERELWANTKRWNGSEVVGQPFMRVSDVDLRLLGDLSVSHGIAVSPVAKDDKEAAVFALRDAFSRDKIEIDPCCTKLRAHLIAATWNDQRTDFKRTDLYGHFDLVDALVYLWRSVVRQRNPRPPAWHFDKNMVVTPAVLQLAKRSGTQALDQVWGKSRWTRPPSRKFGPRDRIR